MKKSTHLIVQKNAVENSLLMRKMNIYHLMKMEVSSLNLLYHFFSFLKLQIFERNLSSDIRHPSLN